MQTNTELDQDAAAEELRQICTDLNSMSISPRFTGIWLLRPFPDGGKNVDLVRNLTILSEIHLYFFTDIRQRPILNFMDMTLRKSAIQWSRKLNTRVFFHPVCPESALPELGGALFIQLLKRNGILLRGSRAILDRIPEIPADKLPVQEAFRSLGFAGLHLLGAIHKIFSGHLSLYEVQMIEQIIMSSILLTVDSALLAGGKYAYSMEERYKNLEILSEEGPSTAMDAKLLLDAYGAARDFLRHPRFIPQIALDSEVEKSLDIWRPVFLYATSVFCQKEVYTERQAIRLLLQNKNRFELESSAQTLMLNLNYILEMRDRTELRVPPRLKFLLNLVKALFDSRCSDPKFAAEEYHILHREWNLFFRRRRGM